MKKYLIVLLLAVTLLSAACSQEATEVGVVARVNGFPIYLTDVEAKYDLSHLGWSGSVSPSLGKLKSEYRVILAELIAQELIFQVLNEKNIPVTEQEMLQAEARVRADYPQGLFEQVMVEEYIDLDIWRRQLRAHLSFEKFLNKILRPRITVEHGEVEAYYNEHAREFNVPAQVHFLLVMAAEKARLEEAYALFRRGADGEILSRELEGVEAQEVKLPLDRLTEKWSKALESVETGGATRALSAQRGYEMLILVDRQPARRLSLQEAYPVIERTLLERKLHEAYAAWLEEEIESADIFISAHLLAEGDEAEDEHEVQPDFLQEEQRGDPASERMEQPESEPGQTDELEPDTAPEEAPREGEGEEQGDPGTGGA
jgi:parvulin-like peptidyl-prolyl isomerase